MHMYVNVTLSRGTTAIEYVTDVSISSTTVKDFSFTKIFLKVVLYITSFVSACE